MCCIHTVGQSKEYHLGTLPLFLTCHCWLFHLWSSPFLIFWSLIRMIDSMCKKNKPISTCKTMIFYLYTSGHISFIFKHTQTHIHNNSLIRWFNLKRKVSLRLNITSPIFGRQFLRHKLNENYNNVITFPNTFIWVWI